MVLKLEPGSESPGGLVKARVLGPTPRVSDSIGLGQGVQICISNKFSGRAYAVGLGPHLENH